MNHPGPLLTDYVDDTLDPSTRAEVDAHLRTCVTCRGEVALSRAGQSAAQRLGEPAEPADLGEAAVAEAVRLATERNPEVTPIAGRARRRPATSRVLAAAGAAAAVLLLVVIGPKLGQDSGAGSANMAAGAGPARVTTAYPQATGVESLHANYTFDALPQVVSQLRTAYVTADTIQNGSIPAASQPALGAGAEGTQVPPLPTADASADPSMLPRATACLNTAFDTPAGTLSRVILATYQGQPAYFGVYLIGPGAELPPTLLQLNIASVHGCQVLGQTTARL